jgi:hypothetical protein
MITLPKTIQATNTIIRALKSILPYESNKKEITEDIELLESHREKLKVKKSSESWR